jgi:hypothetical protein
VAEPGIGEHVAPPPSWPGVAASFADAASLPGRSASVVLAASWRGTAASSVAAAAPHPLQANATDNTIRCALMRGYDAPERTGIQGMLLASWTKTV